VRILTYGTFDLLHVGHVRILTRLREMGTFLAVGISTDEFNAEKSKTSVYGFEHRVEIVRALRCVDLVFAESSWDQKISDIYRLNINVFGIGDDWLGHFDYLQNLCDVVYLSRTPGISTTILKHTIL
jgi:glycerol-3-phosphate cytidylyltransferase